MGLYSACCIGANNRAQDWSISKIACAFIKLEIEPAQDCLTLESACQMLPFLPIEVSQHWCFPLPLAFSLLPSVSVLGVEGKGGTVKADRRTLMGAPHQSAA